MSAALAAGVVLEHLLLPAVHDAQGHTAVVRDSYGHAFCLECAVAGLHNQPQHQQQHQPPLSVLRRKRLLLGLEAALDLLLCLGPHPHASPPQQPPYQHHHHGMGGGGGGGGGGGFCPLGAAEAAQRVLGQGLLGAVLCPIPDPHEREELAGALASAMLKTLAAALQQQHQGDEALAFLAAVYGPVLDAVREQGLRQAGHLLRLVAALIAPQGGLQDLGALLLSPAATTGSTSNGHSQSQAAAPPAPHPSAAAFTASFVAFLELLGAELATPGAPPGRDSAAAAARLEVLALLRRLCECPPARAWVVRQRLAPRVFGPGFFQSVQGMISGGGGGGGDAELLQRNMLALALLLLPGPGCGGGGDDGVGQHGGGDGGGGEAPGPDGGVVMDELLHWQAETFCPAVVKPLLLGGGADLQQGAAAFVARLVHARPEAAEGLVEGELAEHLLESLRVLLRPCNVLAGGCGGGGGAGVVGSIYHHAASLRDLGRAAPLAFFSTAHWPPVLFQELLALLLRVLEHSAAGGAAVLPPALGQGHGGEGEQEDEEEATLLALLDVVEGSLAHSTVLYSENVMAVLLQALHEATARQQRRSQGGKGGFFLCQLALFVGRYASSEVINNKALFPSPPQLEALLAAVGGGGLLSALLQSPPRPGALLAAAFPLMQVVDLVAARAGGGGGGDDGCDEEKHHPLVPGLVEAAAALATLAAAQHGCSGLAEDHACALFLSHVLALLPPASPQLGVLVRHLLGAGLLETALLRLAGREGEAGDGKSSLHVTFVALAAQLVEHGAVMGDRTGTDALAIQGPLLALARGMQLAEQQEQQEQQDEEGYQPSSPAGGVHRWLLGALRRAADPQQLQRWALGSNGSLCTLDGLLGLWLCIGHHVPREEEEPAPDVLTGLASSIAAAPSASLSGLTPTTIALLLRLAAEGTDSSLLLERAAAAVLAALTPPVLAAYADAHICCSAPVDQPDHLAFLLRQGDQPGPQACWGLLLGADLQQQQQQQSLQRRFVATLHLLAATDAAPPQSSKAVLALLLHGLDHTLSAAAHPTRIRRCMVHLLEASAALGPTFWAADSARTRAALVLLHDRVLPVLAAAIGSSSDDETAEWQDGQDALLLVVRAASAALLHAPPDADLPTLPLVSRLLLLLGPRGGDRGGSAPASAAPDVVAAALALFNQLAVLGRLPPDATRVRAALDLAWAAHTTAVEPGLGPAPAALLTNALLHALVAFSCMPTTAHHHPFYDRGFLAATCLAPEQPLSVRKAALVLLCRLLFEGERPQERLEQERQRPRRRPPQQHQQHQQRPQPSTANHRRLRLAVQGCLLEPALRGPAAAVLLQLFRLLPPAEAASAWDSLLLRAPQALLPAQWPHVPSTSTSYVALYISAALQQRTRTPTTAPLLPAGAVDEDGEGRALVEHLLQWLGGATSAALTQGNTDTLPAAYPVALALLLALVEAGAATDAQRAQLRELCCPQASRSSTTVPDDIRMVAAPACQGRDEEGGAGLTEDGVWWPPQLLERWMVVGHRPGQGGDKGGEEGAAPTPTRSDEVDLRGVVARLREAVAE